MPGARAVPIAGGECLTAAYEWRVFAEQDAFDIGQPDAAFTGGLGEFLRVAAMLEGRGRKIATHSAGAGRRADAEHPLSRSPAPNTVDAARSCRHWAALHSESSPATRSA